MTMPREVVAGRFFMVSRRCVQRTYLMRPDDETNNAFVYCLAEAAQRFGIDIVCTVAMSNHHHTIIFDRFGNYPAFLHRFHELFAKSQNVFRRRWENFWSAEAPSVVRLVEPADAIAKIIYVATNPIAAGLVGRVHHWPGVNGWMALRQRTPLRARRPSHFFRKHGPMPTEVTLDLTIPTELGDRDEVLAEIARKIAAVEANGDAERTRTGKRIVGRRQVLKMSWKQCSTAPQPRRSLNPRIAARDLCKRLEAIGELRSFVNKYRVARRRMLRGEVAIFPVGTYWLRIHVGVMTEPIMGKHSGPPPIVSDHVARA